MLVNTSFNIRGEPIVCTPDDALRCFLGTDMDALVLEDMLLLKPEQPEARVQAAAEYKLAFALD
jgi:carbamoyltransferase